jgi:hypothetical protein
MIIVKTELLISAATPCLLRRQLHHEAAHVRDDFDSAIPLLIQRGRFYSNCESTLALLSKIFSLDRITQHSTGAHEVFQDAIH